MRPPKTVNGERRYGVWAGNERGRAEDRERCAAEIPNPPSWQYVQCSRKRGHGPGGEFCKQHGKMMHD